MSFSDWDEKEVSRVHKGMVLIGWRADDRLTNDEALMVRDIAYEALELHSKQLMTSDVRDSLALKAYEIMNYQIMGVQERASAVSGRYKYSKFLSDDEALIDEASVCFYRGYSTAALALLFIILERYLRRLSGWVPGSPDPSFAQLQKSLYMHPDSVVRDEAMLMVSIIYSRFNALSPTQFLFNRHGLLHGLRGGDEVDEMNCARMFILFDLLCSCEGIGRGVVVDEKFKLRWKVYEECSEPLAEQLLMSPELDALLAECEMSEEKRERFCQLLDLHP